MLKYPLKMRIYREAAISKEKKYNHKEFKKKNDAAIYAIKTLDAISGSHSAVTTFFQSAQIQSLLCPQDVGYAVGKVGAQANAHSSA